MWDVIDLSRWQFALTALYHFLFVPLTLGLIFLLAIMETIYVVTGKTIYRDMTRFWGKLFGINFALGVATGLTMEFQFGTNWSFYSNYVGDIFGAPLAMEALMAFFLESTFVGLFFFGWQRLNKYQHLLVTWLVAFGSNLSALWILNANGWMQYPTGAHFDIRGHLPAHIALVGLQPAMLDDYGGSLSELAREQLPAAEQAALAQLAAWGIVPQPANESRCLNYDCLSMENYEGVRLRQYRMTQEEQG